MKRLGALCLLAAAGAALAQVNPPAPGELRGPFQMRIPVDRVGEPLTQPTFQPPAYQPPSYQPPAYEPPQLDYLHPQPLPGTYSPLSGPSRPALEPGE